jgi:hypothetical protein
MALTLLCAGCSQAERDEAEATVRAALGERSRHQPWVVSLVKVGGSWSITLDGPDLHALSFMAPGPRLGESIQERLRPKAPAAAGAPAPPPAAPAQASSKGMRDRHECRSCRRPFVVVYEQEAEEAQELASIACPHCWQNNQVMVAEAAAYTEAYRAEKLEA